MVLAENAGPTRYIPASPVEARDVCGAGDTVLASLCVAILKETQLWEPCKFSTVMARQQLATIGIDTLPHVGPISFAVGKAALLY